MNPSRCIALLLLSYTADCVYVRSDRLEKMDSQDRLVALMLQAESRQKDWIVKTGEGSLQDLSDTYSLKQPVTCYGELGCYVDTFGILPENPDDIWPSYKLYMMESPTKPAIQYDYNATFGWEDFAVQQALRNRSRPLVFLTHGFGGHGQLEWIVKLRRTLIETAYGANVIVIDWRQGARVSTLYYRAAANSMLVANMSARFAIALMRHYDIPSERVHFIGFSLGAQLGGFFAEEVHRVTGQKLGRFTALDCAAPLFERRGIYPRKEHTMYLEAIHTSAGNILWRGKVGIQTNYGHVDYYPNGGIDQPGCHFPHLSCAHHRAHEYYAEALANGGRCLFSGHRCASVNEAIRGACQQEKDVAHFMGMTNADPDEAIFFLKTNGSTPYCLEDYTL